MLPGSHAPFRLVLVRCEVVASRISFRSLRRHIVVAKLRFATWSACTDARHKLVCQIEGSGALAMRVPYDLSQEAFSLEYLAGACAVRAGVSPCCLASVGFPMRALVMVDARALHDSPLRLIRPYRPRQHFRASVVEALLRHVAKTSLRAGSVCLPSGVAVRRGGVVRPRRPCACAPPGLSGSRGSWTSSAGASGARTGRLPSPARRRRRRAGRVVVDAGGAAGGVVR